MLIVFLTAIGVGGATIIGAVIGFIFKNISERFSDTVIALAAGIMLAASINGLILPSLECGGKYAVAVCIFGVLTGALAIYGIDKLIPHLQRKMHAPEENSSENARVNKILLFVMAIAIHNFPEGVAAGVSFGVNDISAALTVAFGIALQNIPEGMVIISPMLSVGIGKRRTLVYAVLTGVVEIIGTFVGYFAVSVSARILPFALAFAGGTMLYVISDEMIPETHEKTNASGSTFALLIGFCLMLIADYFI